MKKGLSFILILLTATVLVACGNAIQEPAAEVPVEEPTTVTTPLPQLSYDKGLEAIDIMFDYMASHDGDTATTKLQNIQNEINDENDFVGSYINIFLVDINFERNREEIIDQIDYFQEELNRRMPK